MVFALKNVDLFVAPGGLFTYDPRRAKKYRTREDAGKECARPWTVVELAPEGPPKLVILRCDGDGRDYDSHFVTTAPDDREAIRRALLTEGDAPDTAAEQARKAREGLSVPGEGKCYFLDDTWTAMVIPVKDLVNADG